MRVTLLWPIGDHRPDDVIDVDPRLAEVLVRERFARHTDAATLPPEPAGPTVQQVRDYAAATGLTLRDARRQMAAELRDRTHSRRPA